MTVAVLTWIAFVLLLGISVSAARPRRYDAPSALPAHAVRPWRNGAAISSEFTSTVACLGMAGVVTAGSGPVLWYPAGVAGGLIVVLTLVVAPLRRSRTYTLPDFAEWRLGSAPLRLVTTVLVVVVGMAFLVAQLHAAGMVVRLLAGMPPWTGWAAVASAGVAVALAGGTGSVTSVQASQFWLKLIVFLGVAVVLWGVWWQSLSSSDVAAFTVGLPGELWDGLSGGSQGGPSYDSSDGGDGATPATSGPSDGDQGGSSSGAEGGVEGGAEGGSVDGASDGPVLSSVFAVLLACALGTMGLPHVIVRLHVSRDGRDARRSIVAAQAMLAMFCVVPALFGLLGGVPGGVPGGAPSGVVDGVMDGALSGVHAPRGDAGGTVEGGYADEMLLTLPARMLPGPAGDLLTGLLAAGVCAAFLATTCGVLAAVGGAVSSCVSRATGASAYRGAVVAVALAALGLTAVTGAGVSMPLVLLGFSLSAATFCPLLLLGIWWRRLTDAGVLAGYALGGGVTGALVVFEQAGVNMGAPASRPALVAVPVAVAAMVLISLVTPGRVAPGVGRMMARMHLPEPSENPRDDRSSHPGDRSPSQHSPYSADY
ncbi:sodium:solute symporter family transporter [Nonomuraea sp. LPB2021202275-12-8]|uniref:sodium:solute symporter family transporter n=1 Tax=Nonomuraea sp. LPB2021202275-12-8 TaxID=3120159 RepID=UPI00300DA2DF